MSAKRWLINATMYKIMANYMVNRAVMERTFLHDQPKSSQGLAFPGSW
jgi:Holliday junction resolvasome RuvABC endonuclease subunit